ncbi:unnamed protein product [Malus baccata var. baccata]
MAMKKIALVVLVVAVCMSAAMAAAPLKAAAATPAATPSAAPVSDASVPAPNGSNMNAVGSLIGASVLSFLALYLH